MPTNAAGRRDESVDDPDSTRGVMAENGGSPLLPHSIVPDDSCERKSRGTARRRFRFAGFVILGVYALFIAVWAGTAAGGSDSSGYFNSARLLAEGRLFENFRVPAEIESTGNYVRTHFIPLGFAPRGSSSQIAPTYPTGLPLHFLIGAKLFGWQKGPRLVEALAAAGAVWLCYLAARELSVNRALAAAGAAALAMFPVFVMFSIQPLSDVPATTWILATLVAALRSRKNRVWAYVAGVAFAVAVLVRPTNVILTPAVLMLYGFDWRRHALFVVAGIPGAIWMATYNQTLYGSALSLGYGDASEHFSISWLWQTTRHFAKWLALMLPAPLLGTALFAVSRRSKRRHEGLSLLVLFGSLAGFYVFYSCSHEAWWYLRFILPAVPALIVSALLGIQTLAPGSERIRRAAACSLVVWAAISSCYWNGRFGVLRLPQLERVYPEASLAARALVPDDALIVSMQFSGSLYYYTDLPILRSDQVTPPDFTRYSNLARQAGRPIYALLFEFEEPEALRLNCPGDWERIATRGPAGLWQYKGTLKEESREPGISAALREPRDVALRVAGKDE